MIHVVATIELNPGTRSVYLVEFAKLVPLVRAEDGCLEYGPTVDIPAGVAVQLPDRPDVVTVIEKWASVEALQLHLKAPHMSDFRMKVKDFVKSTTLQVLTPV